VLYIGASKFTDDDGDDDAIVPSGGRPSDQANSFGM